MGYTIMIVYRLKNVASRDQLYDKFSTPIKENNLEDSGLRIH